MKTYRVEINAVYREVYEVQANSVEEVEDVLYEGQCYNIESECIESDITEIKLVEALNNG